MILPKLRIDKQSKVISLILSNDKVFESQVFGKLHVDYDHNEEIVQLHLLPFSFEDFGDPAFDKKMVRKSMKVMSAASPS